MNLLHNSIKKVRPEHNTSGIIFAFLGGTAIGALAGLLWAPRKGEESRELIKDKALELRKGLGEQLSAFKEKLHPGSPEADEDVTADEEREADAPVTMQEKKKEEQEPPAKTQTTPEDKAHGMVNHLKHTKKDGDTQAGKEPS